MTTLITGGAGFIGAEVVRRLLSRGQEDLVVFDVNHRSARLDDVAAGVEIVQGDLGDFSHVLDAVKKAMPGVIYHLGGMLSAPSDSDPSSAIRANALGTYHVLEAARLFDVGRVVFSSTTATYGYDIRSSTVDDYTLQRPRLIYGATKVFGEHMGLFYRRKHGLDFRAVRYPSVVGPGVTTPAVVQYTSWVIEECARGHPFTVWVDPETRTPVLYFKDAARAVIELGEAPAESIKTAIYLLAGVDPIPTATQLADAVRSRVPGAEIAFAPQREPTDEQLRTYTRLEDGNARSEWGWEPEYDLEQMVDDFLRELEVNPQRYVRPDAEAVQASALGYRSA